VAGVPGLVGIIPALGMMTEAENPGGPLTLNVGQLLLWSFALVRTQAAGAACSDGRNCIRPCLHRASDARGFFACLDMAPCAARRVKQGGP